MIIDLIRHNLSFRSRPIFLWLFIAIIIGLLIGLLSPALFLGLALLVVFIIVCLITPISAIIFLLIFAPLRTLLSTELSTTIPLDIGQTLSAICLLLSLFWHRSTGKTIYFIPSRLYIPLILFIILIIPSSSNISSMSAWLSEWLKWATILIFTIFTLSLSRHQHWEAILFALILSGIANAVVGLYIFLGGSGADHLLINNRFFRAFGTFGQPNPFGGFMGLLSPLAIMATIGYAQRAYHHYWQRSRRISALQIVPVVFYAISAIILGVGVFISWSRGAWLGFILACASIVFAIPTKLKTSLLYSTVLATVISGLWFSNIIPASIVERITSSTADFFAFDDMRGIDITPENYAVVERLAHWQAAISMANENPWIGVGLGHYEIAYPVYQLINWDEPLGHAHNFYLNILAEAGIIGGLGYLLLWLSIIWSTWRARRHPDFVARAVTVGLFGCWIYLAFHSLFDNLFVNNLFVHLGVMLGILAIIDQDIRHTSQVERS